MIMLIAVGAGITAGMVRARIANRKLQPIQIRSVWLVLLAFLPQLLAFYLPFSRAAIPDAWVPPILVISQALMLVFAWQNRRVAGFGLMGIGLMANFLVICLNCGMMPLSPQTVQQLIPAGSQVELTIGQRAGTTKDVLLERQDTRLWFLSDIFTLSRWTGYPLAFSVGDIVISMGAFWLLFSLGGPPKTTEEVSP